MGLFPRVARWDGDDRKDLIIGTQDGKVRIYLNLGSDEAPLFDDGAFLQFGPPGDKLDIFHSCSATPCIVDWDEDGRRDLLLGAGDGRFHLYMNGGTDTEPDYAGEIVLQGASGDLMVPLSRSSPTVADFDDDGRKDIVSGSIMSRIHFFRNIGENDAPAFDRSYLAESASVPIYIEPNARSRPCVCDWTGDGILDLVVGSAMGNVHLYEGIEFAVGLPLAAPPAARLLPAWPNPANPAVTLAFELADETEVLLSVHDAAGRRVAVLADGDYGAGRHEKIWRGTRDEGEALSSGVYLARLRAAGVVETRKLILLR